jgi:ABC-type transport system substrate-binding protein
MRGDPSGFMADFDPTSYIQKQWYKGQFYSAVPSGHKLVNLVKQGNSILNNKKRHQLYRQMEQIVLTEWPLMPLVDPYVFSIVSSKMKGMYVSYTTSVIGLTQATMG